MPGRHGRGGLPQFEGSFVLAPHRDAAFLLDDYASTAAQGLQDRCDFGVAEAFCMQHSAHCRGRSRSVLQRFHDEMATVEASLPADRTVHVCCLSYPVLSQVEDRTIQAPEVVVDRDDFPVTQKVENC